MSGATNALALLQLTKSNSFGDGSKQIEFNSTDMSKVKKVKYSPLVENNVFDEIGEDDL